MPPRSAARCSASMTPSHPSSAEVEMESAAMRRDMQSPVLPETAGPSPASPTEKQTPDLATYVRRWLLRNRGGLRAALIGIVSLALFLLAWHLLTTYRVVLFVRFTNVPSPAAVYESLGRAMHD